MGHLALSLLPFAPVVDGTVLPAHPLRAFASGASADMKVLTGTNREESRLFLVAPGLIDLIDEPAMQGAAGAYGLSQDGLQRYRDNRPGASPGDVMAAFVTDWFFMIPAVRHAEAREDGGGFDLDLPIRLPGSRPPTTALAPRTPSRFPSFSTLSVFLRPRRSSDPIRPRPSPRPPTGSGCHL